MPVGVFIVVLEVRPLDFWLVHIIFCSFPFRFVVTCWYALEMPTETKFDYLDANWRLKVRDISVYCWSIPSEWPIFIWLNYWWNLWFPTVSFLPQTGLFYYFHSSIFGLKESTLFQLFFGSALCSCFSTIQSKSPSSIAIPLTSIFSIFFCSTPLWLLLTIRSQILVTAIVDSFIVIGLYFFHTSGHSYSPGCE